MSGRLRVFLWHNVDGSWCFPCPSGTGAPGMERQLRFLRRVANVVPLREALEALADGRDLPPRAVAITFDDGYRDNLEVAVPLLRRLGLPATFFLVPGLLSGDLHPWWETLGWAFARGRGDVLVWEGQRFSLHDGASRYTSYHDISLQLMRRDRTARDQAVAELTEVLKPTGARGDFFLDWDGARDLVREGFAVGSHTTFHSSLTEEPLDDVRSELKQSRRTLESELGVSIDLLAYPYGTALDYNSDIADAAAAAEYTHAFTLLKEVVRRDSPPYKLGRFLMYPQRGVKGFANVVPLVVKAYRAVNHVGVQRCEVA